MAAGFAGGTSGIGSAGDRGRRSVVVTGRRGHGGFCRPLCRCCGGAGRGLRGAGRGFGGDIFAATGDHSGKQQSTKNRKQYFFHISTS